MKRLIAFLVLLSLLLAAPQAALADYKTGVDKLTTVDAFSDWLVSGLVATPSGSLALTVPSGIAYVGGNRVTPSAVSHTFTASKDTYCFLQPNGSWHFNAVNNGAGQPTDTGLLVEKVVSGASSVTGVTTIAKTAPPLIGATSGGSVAPMPVHVTGDYTVTAGTNVLLFVDTAPATITLPSSTADANTVVSIYNNSGAQITIALADAADYVNPGITGSPTMENGDFCIFVPCSDSFGDQFWQQTSYLSGYMTRTATGLEFDGVPFILGNGLMQRAQAEPAAPAFGWILYVDSGDGNKLKAKASTGTVVTLGTP